MPRGSHMSRPASSSSASSSSGVMKSSQWCVPLGISPTPSAAPISSRRDCGCGWGSTAHQPAGASRRPMLRRRRLVGKCSITSMAVTRSKRRYPAHRPRPRYSGYRTRTFGMHRCSRGILGSGVDARDISPQPRQWFAQQAGAAPTSRADLPASGRRASMSPAQWRSMASRRNCSRTGLSRWSMAEEPFGSHQSLASLPNAPLRPRGSSRPRLCPPKYWPRPRGCIAHALASA